MPGSRRSFPARRVNDAESRTSRLPARGLVIHRVDRMAAISRDLRRDRVLAFYGAEDLVPSEFYGEEDARRAFDGARFVIETAASVVPVSENGN